MSRRENHVQLPASSSPRLLLTIRRGRIFGDRAAGAHHTRAAGPAGCVGVLSGLVGVGSGDAASPNGDEQGGGRKDEAHNLSHGSVP
jgi:hypothetical protein